jgi:hypothetical protein
MRQKSVAKSSWPKQNSSLRLRNRKGQAVIEYVLLLVVVTSLGAIIIRDLVSRNADQPGLLVAKWHSIIKTIADDNPEE